MASKKLVAVITGGNSGIGAAAARKLAQNHFAVSLAGRNQQRLQHVADQCSEIAKSDKAVLTTSGDMTDDSHLESLVRRTLDKFGRIDVLVNNAGYFFEEFDPYGKIDMDAFDQTFKLNVRSVVKLTDLCEDHLFKSRGNVINISSIMGRLPIKALAAVHPIGRIGRDTEVAELIAFLADNNKAGFITAALYLVDGGCAANSAFSAMGTAVTEVDGKAHLDVSRQ